MLELFYTNESDIPDGFSKLYTQQGDKWVLTGVKGMKTQEDITRLQEGLKKERNDHKAVKAQLDAYSTLGTPEELTEKLHTLEELEVSGGQPGAKTDEKINSLVEVRIKNKLLPLERELAETKKQLADQTVVVENYKTTERNDKIKNSVRAAAAEAGVRTTVLEDIEMFAERHFELTEDGDVMTRDGVGVTPMINPQVWLSELKAKKPHWWPDSVGGGGQGGLGNPNGLTGGNPFSYDGWNLTEQGKLIKADRPRAEQLAKSAGTTIGGGKPAAPVKK